MKVKPYKGRYLSRKKANEINDMLLSSKIPDRTALKREAEEFIEYYKEIRAKRNNSTVNTASVEGDSLK